MSVIYLCTSLITPCRIDSKLKRLFKKQFFTSWFTSQFVILNNGYHFYQSPNQMGFRQKLSLLNYNQSRLCIDHQIKENITILNCLSPCWSNIVIFNFTIFNPNSYNEREKTSWNNEMNENGNGNDSNVDIVVPC